MRFRKLNQFLAFVFGYFWLPCPRCGQYTGGHEWNEKDPFQTRMINDHEGEGLCRDCAKELRHEAKARGDMKLEKGYKVILKPSVIVPTIELK